MQSNCHCGLQQPGESLDPAGWSKLTHQTPANEDCSAGRLLYCLHRAQITLDSHHEGCHDNARLTNDRPAVYQLPELRKNGKQAKATAVAAHGTARLAFGVSVPSATSTALRSLRGILSVYYYIIWHTRVYTNVLECNLAVYYSREGLLKLCQ